ncbi:thiolase, N-terminal domain protein [Mycobacterium xenopi 4042]|uniref:acetyl-CoA C-acetyltransferase n=1 Tax=Mycobacterium xenopi 4042 TaxID=1299334 RepID=X8E3C7_MYCXE|nr:thiolase, N-terminal domain protein [Mycobacterium xenopi 4042]
MTTSVIVAGARTPIGKLMGSLRDFSASDLGAIAISGALEKAKVPASLVQYVIMGQVLTAGPVSCRHAKLRWQPGSAGTSRRSRSTRCAFPVLMRLHLLTS